MLEEVVIENSWLARLKRTTRLDGNCGPNVWAGKLAASAAIILLLYGSCLPCGFSAFGPTGFAVTVLLFLGILLKWGPQVESGVWWRLALWVSLASFCASLIGRAGRWPVAGKEAVVILLVFGLWLSASRSLAGTRRSSRLRKIVIASAISFGAAVDWVQHTGLNVARGGEYYGVDFPYLQGRPLTWLRHPYDVYLIYLPGRITGYASLVSAVGFSVAYFMARRRDGAVEFAAGRSTDTKR